MIPFLDFFSRRQLAAVTVAGSFSPRRPRRRHFFPPRQRRHRPHASEFTGG